jgi:hypothetical protein
MSELIRNIRQEHFGQEGEVYFGLFGKYISLFNWQGASEAYVLKCAQYLNNLGEQIITHLCEASIHYCNDFLDAVGQEPKYFDKSRDVLALIRPSSLSIPKPRVPAQEDVPVIHMELNCAWEEEHGMEWVIRDNKVLYVGAYNGENPWADFEPKDSWNYA